MSPVLGKLVRAVDSVAEKLGGIETRLTALEEEVWWPKTEHQDAVVCLYPDEPLFNTGTKPKHYHTKQAISNVKTRNRPPC